MSLCPFTLPGIVLLPGIVTPHHHLLPECTNGYILPDYAACAA
jgi:cytosine/adenosine deaminase-related metal-dependent hydrolase